MKTKIPSHVLYWRDRRRAAVVGTHAEVHGIVRARVPSPIEADIGAGIGAVYASARALDGDECGCESVALIVPTNGQQPVSRRDSVLCLSVWGT